MLQDILNKSGIPLLACAVSLYYAYRVMILKDTRSLRGQQSSVPDDADAYCRDAGLLLLFFAAGALIMAVLELYDQMIAFAQIALWTVITMLLWKRLHDKYEGD